MMFVNKYKISDERRITITFLLIIPCWRTFYVSAKNNILVLFVADININVRQQSAEMNRLIEVAAVNPYLADSFLDKIFVALHVFVNPLCQPANQPQ